VKIQNEEEKYKKNIAKFEQIFNQIKRDEDVDDENELLSGNNRNDDEGEVIDQQYKSHQIKYYHDLTAKKTEESKTIFTKARAILDIQEKISSIIVGQGKKLDTLADNVEKTCENTKGILDTMLETSKEEKNFRNNKCWVLFLLIIAFILLVTIITSMNKGNDPIPY
jgi:t-SNARE complex subunit (syntaxin)